MLGNNAGISLLLLNKFPNLVIWHCSNHCLDKLLNDVVHHVLPVCHIIKFFDKLYAIYKATPKNKLVLENVAIALSGKLNSIEYILGTG